MVDSDNDSNNASMHDLTQYAYSKEIVNDFPRIIAVYEKLLTALYDYAQYHGVWVVIQSVEDALVLMKMQYKQYKKIHDEKGLKNNE